MIPNYVSVVGSPYGLLPPGIYDATIDEVRLRYAINLRRMELFIGMIAGLENIFRSGSREIYLDGSYITTKAHPNDYEICWSPQFVDPTILDPVFLNFANKRYQQLQKYLGEYFPTTFVETASGKPFTEYFQIDRDSGVKKGILRITNYLNPAI